MKRYTDILNEQVTPKVETPKAETPKVETPKTESPKSEENKSETKSVITIIENIKKSIDFEKEKINVISTNQKWILNIMKEMIFSGIRIKQK